MKSKFAKITDSTIGAALIFFAAAAVYKYYMPLSIAVFCALSTTACAFVLLGFTGRKKSNAAVLSKAADDMFFDFMFCDENAPARALCKGLNAHGKNAVTHGGGVFLNGCAAYFSFDAPLIAAKAARYVSRAKHYGAEKLTVFCKDPPVCSLDIDGVSMSVVYGNDVYKLFASLGATPKKRFAPKRKKRFSSLRGALTKDKLPHYLMLSASMFGVAALTGYSVITLVCASVCAALFAATAINAAVRSLRSKKRSSTL